MNKDKYIPQGYKNSTLGIIPKEWEVKRMGDLCLGIYSGKNKTRTESGTYPVYGSTGIIGKTNEYQYEGTRILVARVGAHAGQVSLVSGKYDVSDNTIIIENKECLLLYFAYQQLIANNINKMVFGSGQPLITASMLKRMYVLCPSYAEQNRIANLLKLWDKAIDKQSELIEKLILRKRALMQELLTGKKRLPGFSMEWKRIKAGEIFVSSSVRSVGAEVLLAATQEHGVIPRDQLEGRVTMPTGDLASFKLVEKGDFVISLRSFQGGLEYSEYRGIVSPAYTVLKPRIEIDKSFYRFYFKSSDFIGHLAIAVIGIRDGKQISYDDFCFVKIPYPSIEEQKAISAILIESDKEIELAKEKLASLQFQKRGLMQQLLTGKKRIK